MSSNIFENDEFGRYLLNNPFDMRPEMALIVLTTALSCGAERLAGVARSDAIHNSTPRSAVEGGNVVPDRSFTQGRVSHPRHESGRWVCFALDVSHSPIVVGEEMEGELEPSDAGT
jgi:hypothetical protein